jgi:hypothetical protein
MLLDMAVEMANETTSVESQSDVAGHTYSVSAGNKAVGVAIGVILLCAAGVFGSSLLVPHLRAELLHLGLHTSADLVFSLTLLGIVSFSVAIRLSRMNVTITNSQVTVVRTFRSYTIPFAQIRGRRVAGRGMYLYRRGKSRVWVHELFRPDDFYMRWKASIYDLDRADRLKRKAAGQENLMDSIFDNTEQHPAIGGP